MRHAGFVRRAASLSEVLARAFQRPKHELAGVHIRDELKAAGGALVRRVAAGSGR